MTINEQSRVTTGRENEPSERIGRYTRPGRSFERRRAVCGGLRRPGRLLAGEPGRAGQLGRHRIRAERGRRRGRAAARAGGPRTGRGAADRLRADAVGPGAGRRRAAARHQAADHRRDLRPGHPAGPDGRHPRADAAGPRPVRHPAGRDGRAFAGHHGLRVAAGQGRQGRRAAGAAAADRRGRARWCRAAAAWSAAATSRRWCR